MNRSAALRQSRSRDSNGSPSERSARVRRPRTKAGSRLPARVVRPVVEPEVQATEIYVAVPGTRAGCIQPFDTDFLSVVNDVDVERTEEARVQPQAPQSLASLRGYEEDDLYAVAEIAHQHLFGGNVSLALTLFEGLTAIAPQEFYFALALAFTLDESGQRPEAHTWYQRAAVLDPTDGRPDVNRAELFLEAGDVSSARGLLATGLAKARKRKDATLERKSSSLLQRLNRTTAS